MQASLPDTDSSPAPALDGGLSLLEAIVASPRGVSFTRLQAVVPQSKATVVRLLKVLQTRGYASKDSAGLYRPGPALRSLGVAADGRDELRRAGASRLQPLLEQVGNTVLLLHWDGVVFECVAKAALEYGLAMQPVGNTCAEYGATPWGLIGWDELDEVEQARAKPRMPRGFPRALNESRCQLAESGVVRTDVGKPATLRRLAAPIHDGAGALLGCLAIGGNALTITDRQLPTIQRQLVTAATAVAADLAADLA